LPDLFIGNEKLEVVTDFLYLGLKMNYNNKWHVAQRDLYNRASRAMFLLMKKCKDYMLPVDLVIDLFDKTVLPVLTYGCEIWGFEINDIILKLQLRFYKFVLKLRLSTPSMMVFGEIGKFPVNVSVKTRTLCFWYKLSNQCFHNGKLSSLIYNCLLTLYKNGSYKNKYLNFVETTLNELGMSSFWLNQGTVNFNVEWFKNKVKRSLMDQFLQSWYSHVDNDDIFVNYRIYKTVFEQADYLTILPYNQVLSLLNFRTLNNDLPVNKLRFQSIPRNERICTKCTLREIGDEFHYLFVCPSFNEKRQQCLPKYYFTRPSAYKFFQLLSSTKKSLLRKLSHFVNIILSATR
jgi:hypothetical protein